MVMEDDKIARKITGMGPVSLDEHEALKVRVYKLSDDLSKQTLDHAKLEGRVDSATQSIERLRMTSATSDQVTALATVTNLKLDHLLEKQGDMKRQIGWATKTIVGFVLSVAAGLILWWFSQP